jgi:hypothetical protein
MEERFRESFLTAWRSPLRMQAKLNSPPATEDALRSFEAEFGPIPPHFRWFLSACGGGPVGPEWVDDITSLTETHRRFREEFATAVGLFIIGWDGRGDPFGIEMTSDRILGIDHDNGAVYEVAPSFEALLARELTDG